LKDSDRIHYSESFSSLQEKVDQLATLIRGSNNSIIYTGETFISKRLHEEILQQPGYEHNALAKLQQRLPVIEAIITTNDDGLQTITGIPPEKLIEVYGSPNSYICKNCGIIISRYTSEPNLCCPVETCANVLVNNHVKEGDPIPEKTLSDITRLAEIADLAIILGASMCIKPISRLPMFPYLKRKARKIVICHTNTTPFDMDATLRIFASANDILHLLMPRFNIELEGYFLNISEKYSSVENLPEKDTEGYSTQNFRKTLQEAGKRYLPWTCACGFVNESYPSICEKCEIKNPSYHAQARSVDSNEAGTREFLAELLVWGRQ